MSDEKTPARRVSPAVDRLQQSVAGIIDVSQRLVKQTHLTRVLIYSSFLENLLREAITSHLARKSQAAQDKLYENNGPLSTFSYKIKIASAFGIISVDLAAELDKIRDIRNKFAHTREEMTFETPKIVVLINRLSNATRDKTPEAIFGEAYAEAVRGLTQSKRAEKST